MEKTKLSWSSSFHLRIPMESSLYIFKDNSIGTLETFLNIESSYSMVHGLSRVSKIYTAEIDKAILNKIFRIEENVNSSRQIETDVLFHNGTDEESKKNILQIVEAFNKKSKFHLSNINNIDKFELSLSEDI
ncbi:hypothetical protein ACNSOL_12425 (plasmid) [Aliarcobacter lanthieri]|uniref:hypothetical protein n=1 Tax=Aliarcobacter lanthieri TaxID=1355374 RepID=UPI003AAE3467